MLFIFCVNARIGLGFASAGYCGGAYARDPYGGYDAYYHFRYGHAFSYSGFGGRWYNNNISAKVYS